ncbi:MAG: ribonuclease activity regulator RraA [Rhizobiales bacterium]|nr:ribonuclease activity regulator RraA [Hyphomicrobiales bacterium]
MSLSPELRAALATVSTATIHTVLLKQGIRRSYMRGPQPLTGSTKRTVGTAFTLRFIPSREDVATPASWGNPISTRAAIEEMPEGVVVVADALGVQDAGIFGDILAVRMAKRGVAGLVTDGMMRDRVGVLASGLPIWCAGIAAPSSVNGLTFVGWQEPVGCGGVAVFPDDIIVADGDGAICIPAAQVERVAKEGPEQELFEAWVVTEVEKGTQLPGLYPPNDENKAKYAAWRAKK